MDIQEANAHAFQSTPHHCDGTFPNFSNCDRGGCGAKISLADYGPGNGKIDTNKPFTVHAQMSSTRVEVTLHQGLQTTNASPRCSLGPTFGDGMVLVMSNWGGSADTMKWLDEPPCGDTPCNSGAVTFSNFTIS